MKTSLVLLASLLVAGCTAQATVAPPEAPPPPPPRTVHAQVAVTAPVVVAHPVVAVAPPPPPPPVREPPPVRRDLTPIGEPRLQTRVREIDVAVKGGLEDKHVRRMVRQRFGALRPCYEEGLRRNPNLRGQLIVQITVKPDGMIGDVVDFGSTLGDPKAVSCMLHELATTRFTTPEHGGVTIVYTAELTPEQPSASDEADDAAP